MKKCRHVSQVLFSHWCQSALCHTNSGAHVHGWLKNKSKQTHKKNTMNQFRPKLFFDFFFSPSSFFISKMCLSEDSAVSVGDVW